MQPISRLPGRAQEAFASALRPLEMTALVRDKHAEDANISCAPAPHARFGLIAELDPGNA
jgi:hypothetical protein